ncbi:MAG: hypothetical protein QXH96_01655 [Candidatus Geothermarchaeota archaeon]
MSFLKRDARKPLYIEVKGLLGELESRKEWNKLWSSRLLGDKPDIFVSSVVLWFTHEAYEKLKMKDRLKESYYALKDIILRRLKKMDLALLNFREWLEIFQASLSLLRKGQKYVNVSEMRNALIEIVKKNMEIIKGWLLNFDVIDPLKNFCPTVVLMTMLEISLDDSEGFSETFKKFLERISEGSTEVDPMAVYWISELLLAYICQKSKSGHEMHEIIRKVALEIYKLAVYEEMSPERISKLPLDKLLTYFLAGRNLLNISREIDLPTKELEKRYHLMLDFILHAGLIEFMNMKANLTPLFKSIYFEEGGSSYYSFDTITLSLLIGSLEKSSRHIVTYITEYDLSKIEKIHKISFGIGSSLIIGSSFLLALILTGKLDLGFLYGIIMLSTIYAIIVGLKIVYDLTKQSIKNLSDLKRDLLLLKERLLKLIEKISFSSSFITSAIA